MSQQAFPGSRRVQRMGYATDEFEPVAGMTLRDYFAAKAMGALIMRGEDEHMRGYEGWQDEFAKEAGRFADAQMRERAK